MNVATFLECNSETAKIHQAIPTLTELEAMGREPPHILVDVGVIRNAGGHIEPALKDIIALDAFLRFDEIMVIHHTDCGTTHFTNEGIRNSLKARMPTKHHPEIENMTFGAINDLKQSVIDDIDILRENPYVRQELAAKTFGFVYDLKSGKLEAVKA